MLVRLATQTSTQTSVDGSTHYRIKVAKTSVYVFLQKIYVILFDKIKSKRTRDKNICNMVRGGTNG